MEPELQETFDDSEAAHGGDCGLSDTGEKQLRFALRTKAADLQSVTPHVVYASPLQRALRTALTAYPDCRIVVDPRLREVDRPGPQVTVALTCRTYVGVRVRRAEPRGAPALGRDAGGSTLCSPALRGGHLQAKDARPLGFPYGGSRSVRA